MLHNFALKRGLFPMVKRILLFAVLFISLGSMVVADTPISGLPAVTAPAGADLTVIVHSGTTSKATLTNIGLNAFTGVAVGGALTGATTGAFSAGLFASSFTANGPISFGTANNSQMLFGVDGASNASFDLGIASSGQYQFRNGTGSLGLPILAGDSTAGATLTYVPPMYTQSGAAVASSAHSVLGQCVFASTTTCTMTFSGAAAFQGASAYACMGSGNSPFDFWFTNNSGTSVTLTTGSATGDTAFVVCTGQ